jgi:hypothetical protein
MSTVGLFDHCSTIPNLALMRLSAYHKARGNAVRLFQMRERPEVPLDVGEIDSAVVSCVFSWGADSARTLAAGLLTRCQDVQIGGSGVDWGKMPGTWLELPPEIEATAPDYDLYGDDRAIGFCQRGCIRACSFCLVSKKEGVMTKYPFVHPSKWVPDRLNKVALLDNEFAAQSVDRQREVIEWFRDTGRMYSITQGYDARIIAGPPKGKDNGEELARILAGYKPHDIKFKKEPRLIIAWDYPGIEEQIRRAVPRLLAAGFAGREILCYVLSGHPPISGTHNKIAGVHAGGPCGYIQGHSCELCHAETLHRFNVLWKEYGVFPFVMKFNKRMDGPWLNAFARYVNRVVFRKKGGGTLEWEDYNRPEHERSRREAPAIPGPFQVRLTSS